MSDIDPSRLATALSLGIANEKDAIKWADSAIASTESPPYWLIELSTSNPNSPVAASRILPCEIELEEICDSDFLGAMAVRYIDYGEPIEVIRTMMYDRFCACEWSEMTDLRKQIYIIDDEMDHSPKRAEELAFGLLNSHLKHGRDLAKQARR